MNSNKQETLRTSRSTTKKKIGVNFILARGPNNGEEADLEVEDADREEDEADLGAGDRTHNQLEVAAAAATHHHSLPVSHEGGGRGSTEWKERVESANPYIKASEIAAISLRARRLERERGVGTRAKKFSLSARARASHPAAA
jgi:hypothetical protein